MRVTSVEVHPEGSSDIAVLSFRDPRRLERFNVKALIGLDADEIVPRFYGVSGTQKFYNLSLQKRDVIMRIELNPVFKNNETYSGLRDALYRMIASSRTGVVQIRFKDGEAVIAAVSGFVSKLEAPHFNKTPEVQITVQCSDPMLRALSLTAVDVSGLDPALTVINDALSTAPHGFEFDIAFSAATPSFVIGNDGWEFRVTPVGGFLSGDVLHVSSEHNGKSIYVNRGVDTIHLADVVAPGSVWPIIFPGENTFVCGTPANVTWNSILYYATYWGV